MNTRVERHLNEVKYNDLNNIKKLKSVKDVQRAAHSQGYDVSEPKQGVGDHYDVDLTHRKTGQKVTPSRGGKLGGAHKSGGKVDTTLVNQVAASLKRDREERGGVDKRPKAKEERKTQAAENKKRKQRDRDPFTRGKTFESFVSLCYEEHQGLDA